jgi:hypothetical protein
VTRTMPARSARLQGTCAPRNARSRVPRLA